MSIRPQRSITSATLFRLFPGLRRLNHAEHLAAGCAHLLDGSIKRFRTRAVDGDESASFAKRSRDRNPCYPPLPQPTALFSNAYFASPDHAAKLPVPTSSIGPHPRLASILR